jgi:hypothetical protein
VVERLEDEVADLASIESLGFFRVLKLRGNLTEFEREPTSFDVGFS